MHCNITRFSKLLQKSFLPVIFIILFLPAFAQVTTFPMDYQLYPRSVVTNRAHVKVAGSILKAEGYKLLRLKVYRNSILQKDKAIRIFYNGNGIGFYSFNHWISAELADYSFSLYGIKDGVETLLKSAANVVAGDAYIIQGQSNALANSRVPATGENNADDPSNAPYRNYVRVYGSGSPNFAYTKAWFIGRGNVWYDTDGNTGQWGMRMASNIAGTKKIPVAIFNGSSPGDPIAYFARNDANPADQNTNYGRLLSRIKEAGLENNIRALVWYQGESDVLGTLSSIQLTTAQYKTAFKELVADWKKDYSGLSKFYIFQIRFGCGMSTADNCLKIQEAQRQAAKESKEIFMISPANTTQLFDGGAINNCHYKFVDGYKNIGDWASPLLLRDLYKERRLPSTIESPEPISASFTGERVNGMASHIKLVLKDQSSAFTITGDLRNLFRLDGGTYLVNSVVVHGNSVLIDFSRGAGTTSNPVSISYRAHDGGAAPVLTNSGGLALVNFEYIPIEPFHSGYIKGAFDKRIINNNLQDTALVKNATLAGITTFPNPVRETLVLNYPTIQQGLVELKVTDLSGRPLITKTVAAVFGQNQFRLNVSTLKTGIYILQIRKGTELTTLKFIVAAG